MSVSPDFAPNQTLKNAPQILQLMKGFFDLNGKEGVFVSLLMPSHIRTSPIITFLVGRVPGEKADKYRSFSFEKPFRAFKNGHTTSYRSRDPETNKWGGGFFLRESSAGFDFGIGTSGFTEAQDMIFSILLAYFSHFITVEEAISVAKHVKEIDPSVLEGVKKILK